MIEYATVYSQKRGIWYRINTIKSYRIDQAIDVAADNFEIVLGNPNYSTSKLISSGDKLRFYINDILAMEGFIDDVDIEYTLGSNDIRLTGRDFMSVLLDNDANPATYNNIGLQDYIGKVLPQYGVNKWTSSNNTKFDKIVVSPGENEYSVIERLCQERNLIPIYIVEDQKFYCSNRISTTNESYYFSNDYSDTIKILDCQITISNDIKNEVIVYGGDYEKNKNLKGTYKDSYLKTKKRRVINDGDIEKIADAEKRAKEEFYNINRNALTVQIKTNTKQVYHINKCARVTILKAGFSAYLLVDSVSYSKDVSNGSITNLTLKLMPGVGVSYEGNDIPILPKL